MKHPILFKALGPALSIALLSAGPMIASANETSDFEWPRLLVVGTPGTGTASFASANGWAPILQKEVGAVVRVVPEDNESMRYRRLTDRRDITVSSVAGAEMLYQIEGVGGYATTKPVAQRIIWHHTDTPWGLVVSGDSKLQTVEDLKDGGYRVAKGMFSPAMISSVTDGLGAYLGLSAEQIEQTLQFVPAGSYGENCRSVVEGKADVAWCSPISSVMSEMEGAPGSIRWLPLDNDNTEAWGAFLEHRPMLIPTEISLGVSTARGIDGATSNFLYSVPADADADFVYNLVKWFHQSYDAYKGSHPMASRMSLEQFRTYLDRSPLPVHEGTVKYLEEIGVWTDKDNTLNEAAKKKMDQWMQARQAAQKEAAKAGIKISGDNPDFIKILNKHTSGLERFRSRL
ncbi:TAXI family TRAP transporter solute-binding subunit [Alcanivorax sp. 24]|uniref:TAXI family TRAP transporter solute-binding subunit n=1 Tax=Alcanivorax sp. 24 TaxID=2545266 RepID=UPI0010605FBA|nr:TAXI family TRAP transporter solute-binding subunit [Alcanivorax sp. 24]